MDEQLYKKIISKKEFSKLPRLDVEKAFEKFDNKELLDEEKIKKTRDLLRRSFGVFSSNKLLILKEREPDWILKKHISTRERLSNYPEIYNKILGDLEKNFTLFDLGAGVNGFSYIYLNEMNKKASYIGVESIGQLVELMNHNFKLKKIKNFKAVHLSLFELEDIKKIINSVEGYKVVFLFKVIDSLEMLERNYSKKLIKELSFLVNRIVISFASESLHRREKFLANRNWLMKFIKNNFKIIETFEINGENYLIINLR